MSYPGGFFEERAVLAAGKETLPGASGERAKGSLIPEVGSISVLVPAGQMGSRCQDGQIGALIILSLMTLPFI